MQRTLNLGIAGLGIASSMILPGVSQFKGFKIRAAADLNKGLRAEFENDYKGRSYSTVEDMCKDEELDVIWIATPNHLHCEHTLIAANSGKHIICTKPMALSVQECQEMCYAADRNGVYLLCGQTYSMSPDIQAMRAQVDLGCLGRLTSIHAWMYTDWLLKPREQEELDETRGGGVVHRHAPHIIDTIRLLGGGRLRSVRGSVGRWMKERPCAGNFSAFMEFEDGTPATIAYSGYGYFDTSELVWGIGNRMYSQEERINVRKMLSDPDHDPLQLKAELKEKLRTQYISGGSGAKQMMPGGAGLNWFGVTIASFERGDIRQSPKGILVYNDDGYHEIEVPQKRGVGTLEASEMYNAVVNNIPLEHDGRWAFATAEAVAAILKSSDEQCEVMLSHQCGVSMRKNFNFKEWSE